MPSDVQATGYLKKVLAHDERVLLIVRQHWLVLFKHIIGSLLLLIVVAALVVWTVMKFGQDHAQMNYLYLLLLVPFVRLIWHYLLWKNHVFVVTTRRVVQLSGVFSKEVVDSLLEKVNDVKTEQSFLGRIFGYGDIEILTASETGANAFRHIAQPLELKRAMLDAKEALAHVPS